MQCTYYEYIYGWFVKQETDTYMYMIYIVLIYYWVHHDFRVKNIYSSNLCSICVLCLSSLFLYMNRSLLNLGYAVWNPAWALLLMWRSRKMNFNQYIFDQFVLGILCQSLSSLSHHWLDPWVIFLVADNPRLHSLFLFKHHGAVVAVIVW